MSEETKRDENDKLKAGQLPSDPFSGTKRVQQPRLVDANDKPPVPAEPAAERALMASLLWAGSFAPDTLRVSVVADILPDGGAMYDRDCGDIYDAMLECVSLKQEHDPVAVAARAAARGKGREALGVDALLRLQGVASTVSETQARVYAQAIRVAWAKRCSINELRVIMQDALRPTVTDVEIYERSQKAALAMMERTATTSSTVSIRQSAEQLFIDLSKPGTGAMSTGLRDVDIATNDGLRAPETSIIAARTNVGKSTIASQIALHIVSSDATAGALYVSMEMPHRSFTTKLLAARARGVSVAAIRRKSLNQSQWTAITQAVADVKDLELHFTVSMTQTLASVFSAAAERARLLAKASKRLALVVVDHIGLVKPSTEVLKRGTREQQVAETSRGLRFIATELGCHVMALAQIHRDAERQRSSESMPKLHHLRESGSLEQDADQIFILHRPRDPQSGLFVRDAPAAFALAKGRLDETAVMLLGFEGGRYVDWNDTTRTFQSEYGGGED